MPEETIEYNNPYCSPKAVIYESSIEDEMQYAGFLVRFFAYGIDLFILYLASITIFSAYALVFKDGAYYIIFSIILNFIIPMVFSITFWRYIGATPGKVIFNTKIVDEKTGKPPAMWRLVVRYLSYIISTLPLLLGFIWVIFDKRKQAWHDKLARTVVIKC